MVSGRSGVSAYSLVAVARAAAPAMTRAAHHDADLRGIERA